MPPKIAQAVCHTSDQLAEAPLWDHRAERLLWIDIQRGRVQSWSEDASVCEVMQADALIGSIALAGDADLLLATSKGFMRWEAASGRTRVLSNPIAGEPVLFNSGRVDAAGRFWVTTMPNDAERRTEPLGALCRLDPDGSFHRVAEGLVSGNGMDWSPDGRTLYLADTPCRLIYAYDFDVVTGTIRNRRVLATTAEEHGFPAGLAVEEAGCIWSAAFAGEGLCRFDASGRLIEKIDLPMSCPTGIAFGGAGYSTAFITTSHVPGLDQDAATGALLQLALPTCGRPSAVFGQQRSLS